MFLSVVIFMQLSNYHLTFVVILHLCVYLCIILSCINNLTHVKAMWYGIINKYRKTFSIYICYPAGAYDHNVYIYDAESGAQYWTYTTEGQVKDTACVHPTNGRVYVGSHDQTVYCLDIQVSCNTL